MTASTQATQSSFPGPFLSFDLFKRKSITSFKLPGRHIFNKAQIPTYRLELERCVSRWPSWSFKSPMHPLVGVADSLPKVFLIHFLYTAQQIDLTW